MSLKRLARPALLVLSLLTFFPRVSAAQDDAAQDDAAPAPAPEVRRDHARFRGGVALEGGAIIAPGAISLGIAGVQGQIGAQINNLIGVYVTPGFDIVFGGLGGVNLSSAVMVDFTLLDDWFTVGAGPNFSFFAALGGAGATAGALYGGRLHFALNIVGHGVDPVRRKAFVVGLDVNLLGGAVGFASTTTAAASVSQFVVQPVLTLGYQAF